MIKQISMSFEFSNLKGADKLPSAAKIFVVWSYFEVELLSSRSKRRTNMRTLKSCPAFQKLQKDEFGVLAAHDNGWHSCGGL